MVELGKQVEVPTNAVGWVHPLSAEKIARLIEFLALSSYLFPTRACATPCKEMMLSKKSYHSNELSAGTEGRSLKKSLKLV
jgi:hypothetical protein